MHESCRMGRRIVMINLICPLGHCECDGHIEHKLTQRRLTADWLVPRDSDCSRIYSKVSSDWLPSYFKASRPVLEIFKMAGYFPDSPLMVVIVDMFYLFMHFSSSSSSSFLALQPFKFGFYTLSFFYRMSASNPTPFLEGKFNFGMCSPMEVGKRLGPCSYSFFTRHSCLAPLLRLVRLEWPYQQPPALLEHVVLSLRFSINFRKGREKWEKMNYRI
jgi:hypothetical protein